MKVQVYSKFSKNKIPKKVKSPNSMWNGRFDTSKCRGKLEKMGAPCTHSPQMPRSTKKKIQKNQTNSKQCRGSKTGPRLAGDRWSPPCPWRPTTSRSPTVARWPHAGPILFFVRPHFSSCLPFFSSFFPHFWALWLTPPHWLQHMPALPRVHLKTSNTHNFWSVAPKIMKFALMQSLFRDASSHKVSNFFKIVWNHTTQPITGLSPIGTSGP
jgi:hypothetical protein